jgi:NAD(P)-dependent dehydrogenase (short-subunit alcohol dehydrogenase family)
MQHDFTHKVALVTGGTSGIGKTTALAFATAGAKVVISGRRAAEGQAVVEAIEAAGGTARFIRADVAVEADVKNLVEQTVAAFGRLDFAFNNAGVEWMGPLTEATEADYRRVFDINVWGVLNSMKHEVPAMLKNGGGAIVNTSSVAGHIGMAGASIYIASKHAVEGLTKTAALEFGAQGVRVNAVAPAVIETDMIDRFAGKDGPVREHLASLHPIGRTGRTEEIAGVVLFLCSEAASFILGESVKVDGGLTAQ